MADGVRSDLVDAIAEATHEYERHTSGALRHLQWHAEMAEHLRSELSKLGYRIVKVSAKASRWHRVLAHDGSLWMETSDREEALDEAMRRGFRMQRLWVEIERTEWRDETP